MTFCLVCALVAFALPTCAGAAPGTLAQQTATARARLGAMQNELGSTLSQYDAATAQLSQIRAQIAANRHALTALDASIARGQQHLAAEALFLYRTDGNGFAEALLSAGSLDQFTSRLFSLTRLASLDAEMLGQTRRDRIAATRLATVLADRERRQAALVAQVSARRTKAQAALDAQQSYADSLAKPVSAALQKEQAAPSTPVKDTPAPPSTSSHAVTHATVAGRSGTYAVLTSDPKSYVPAGLKFTGKATWYGNSRPNMHTSSGRAFDERDFTCAHKSLPFGTRIAVSYGGRKVIVVVTDRGPYGKGRVIDLSRHAAEVIGLESAGVGAVHCEVVRPK
jgi:rare lipoprotein A (peptidoglycan hydrolase)